MAYADSPRIKIGSRHHARKKEDMQIAQKNVDRVKKLMEKHTFVWLRMAAMDMRGEGEGVIVG